MQVKVNRQKFQSISNLTLSADLHGIPAPEESVPNGKKQFACSQKPLCLVFLDITIPYWPANIRKYFENYKWKAKTTSNTQQ